jgi:membrane-associated phospholipid phosphatase
MTSTVAATGRRHHAGLGTSRTGVDQEVEWRPTLLGVFVRFVLLSAVLTAAGIALVELDVFAGLRDADLDISQWFVSRRTPAWNDIAQFWSDFADTIVTCSVAFVATALLWWRHRRRDAVLVAFGLALEAATFITVNNLVQRERPPIETVGAPPGTYSFPSGHVAATIVLYGGLAIIALTLVRRPVLRFLVAAVPVVLAGWVAWARIYRGMHYALDVLVGVALGITVLVLMVWLLRRTTHEHEEIPT